MRFIKYLLYVIQHRRNYWIEGRKFIKHFETDLMFSDVSLKELRKSLWTHDLSKFSIAEFVPYANWFYSKLGVEYTPTKHPNGNNDIHEEYRKDFESAWLHHYSRNKHHWNFHYKLGNSAYTMPLQYVIEMIIDWSAMARKFNDSPLDYYMKNRNTIHITKDTEEALLYYLERWEKVRK